MQICGIVAEYNPLHRGHAYQIQKAREQGATHIVAVMSGNFVQRGEPAIFEKHARAGGALASGVDLVLELPAVFATASAEWFAGGGIGLLAGLGCVDAVCFGAEDPDEMLFEIATLLSGPGFLANVQAEMKTGIPYAKARERAVANALGQAYAKVLKKPNNILAIEYLKAAGALGFSPRWQMIRRKGAAHDEMPSGERGADAAAESCPDENDGGFLSASAIRAFIADGRYDEAFAAMPAPSGEIFAREIQTKRGPVLPGNFEKMILASLRKGSALTFASLPDTGEGLAYRLLAAAKKATSLEEVYRLVQTKRYPLSRVRRLVLGAFLGVDKTLRQQAVPYVRVLGFNKKGEEILKKIKASSSLPVSSSLMRLKNAGPVAKDFAEFEARATDLYVLGMPEILPAGKDFTTPAVKY